NQALIGIKVLQPTHTPPGSAVIVLNPPGSPARDGGQQITIPISPPPSALTIQNNLRSLFALGGDAITPKANVVVLGQDGGPFTVIFTGELAKVSGITLLNGTGNTATTNGSSTVGAAAGVTVTPSISVTTATLDSFITATDIQTAVTPSVNTEVQRLIFEGTTAGTFRLTY